MWRIKKASVLSLMKVKLGCGKRVNTYKSCLTLK